MRNWTDSSTFGMVGLLFVFLLLVITAGWITLRIMEAMSPA
jgi:flagellar biogenesis protein FliO